MATQKCSVPGLLARPAGKGMPQEEREGGEQERGGRDRG